MNLNDMSGLIEEARSDVDNSLANLAEIFRELEGKMDSCLTAGKIGTAEAISDPVNRIKLLTALGQSYLQGITLLGDTINALGLE